MDLTEMGESHSGIDLPEVSPSIRLIAVHLGASNSRNNEIQRHLAKQVCESVMRSFCPATSIKDDIASCPCSSILCQRTIRTQRSVNRFQSVRLADEAVVRAIKLMEDHKSLNCGLGSNLNMQGLVECDASLMSSVDQIWVGVGAVSGCRNPIRLAKSLLDHHAIARPLGLVQPNFLVASGAKQWMQEHCPSLIVPKSHLISANAFSKYQKLKSSFDHSSKDEQVSKTDCDDAADCDNSDQSHQRLDTVGAVAVDCENNFSCAISSGGIMLKHRGRLGQAAVPGAGCWAQDSVAITTTGVGEYLTATLFARKFHDKLQTLRLLHDLGGFSEPMTAESSNRELPLALIREAMNQCFKDLLDSPALGHVPLSERLAGMLAVSSFETNLTNRHQNRAEPEQQTGEDKEFKLYLSYGHNTRSLCIGYMLASDPEAVSFVSRDDDNDKEKKESGSASSPTGVSLGTIVLNCGRAGNES